MENAVRKEEFYTIDYIYSLPDGKRAELIDGVIYNMAPPKRRHQRVSHFFDRMIGNYIEKNGGPCEVNAAPFAVFLDDDEYTYVEPDITVVCDRRKLDDIGCHGAPDWVIEIVSPNSRRMDYFIKLAKYQNAGVREYWIVDPDKDRVVVYYFEDDVMELHTMTDTIKVNIYDDLSLDLSRIRLD